MTSKMYTLILTATVMAFRSHFGKVAANIYGKLTPENMPCTLARASANTCGFSSKSWRNFTNCSFLESIRGWLLASMEV